MKAWRYKTISISRLMVAEITTWPVVTFIIIIITWSVQQMKDSIRLSQALTCNWLNTHTVKTLLSFLSSFPSRAHFTCLSSSLSFHQPPVMSCHNIETMPFSEGWSHRWGVFDLCTIGGWGWEWGCYIDLFIYRKEQMTRYWRLAGRRPVEVMTS